MSKKRLKKNLILALVLGLTACSSQAPAETQETENVTEQSTPSASADATETFNAICDEIFKEYFQENYITMHYSFEDPQSYGLDPEEAKVSLVSLLPDEEYDEETRDYYNELLAIDESSLSAEDAILYQELLFQLGTGMDVDASNFDYFYQFWAADRGPLSELVILFTSYPIYSLDDTDKLIEIFEQMPVLADEVEDYTKGQIEKGTFMVEGDSIKEYLDAVIAEKENRPILTYFQETIDALDADQSDKEKAIERIKEAIDTYYYPAFERFREIYNTYSDQGQPVKPLTSFDHGEEYYELIIQASSNTSEDIDQIEEWVITQFITLEDELADNLDENQQFSDLSALRDNFSSVEEIITFLQENYSREFPEVGDMDISVEQMGTLQNMDNTASAYTITQAYDSNRPYLFYYSPDYTDPQALNFYVTVAHESIPGHIYDEQYIRENISNKVFYILDNLSYAESWATYASERAVGWLDLDEKEKHNYILYSLLNDCYLMLLDLEANKEQRSFEKMQKDYGLDEETYAFLVQNPGYFFKYSYGRLKIHEWFVAAEETLGEDFDRVAFNDIILENPYIHWDLIQDQIEEFIGEKIR